jgi:hypothetical protein
MCKMASSSMSEAKPRLARWWQIAKSVKMGGTGLISKRAARLPVSTFPHGNGNDIYHNGPNWEYPVGGSELRTLNTCEALHVDWTGNYWGAVEFLPGPEPFGTATACDGKIPGDWYIAASFQSSGYLAYVANRNPLQPLPGPITTAYYSTFVPVTCENGVIEHLWFQNTYNSFYLEPGQIATEYIPIPVS